MLCTINALSQDKRYVIVKGGFGLPYGAWGTNIEYRWKNYGTYVGGGYLKEQSFRDVHLSSSFNTCLGLKYYFLKPQDGFRPVLGLHAGWLNNYYSSKINTTSYNYNVYGLAGLMGLYFSENIVSLEISMLIDPGMLIYKPATHPYYSDKVYITPSIGVGVNLYALKIYLRDLKNRRKLELIDTVPNIITNKKDSILPKKQDYETEKIVKDCNDNVGYKMIKKFFKDKNGNSFAVKQIAEDMYVFIKIQKSGAITSQTLQINYLDSTTKLINVFMLKSLNKNDNIETIVNKFLIKDFKNIQTYYLISGKSTVFYYANSSKDFSIRLNDLKMKNYEGNKFLYYDEILICLLIGD